MSFEGAASGRSPSSATSSAAKSRPSEPTRPVRESDLVHRFRERLRLFALRRLEDETAAKDVAQETLRRVLTALREERIENPEALPAFVFQTARHVCSHHYRSSARRKRARRRLKRILPWRKDATPLSDVIAEERRRGVRRALGELRESDADLLRMFYYEGKDTGEVARALDISPGAARVRKHRALRRLCESLDIEGDEAASGMPGEGER